jgi:hypothetical protein
MVMLSRPRANVSGTSARDNRASLTCSRRQPLNRKVSCLPLGGKEMDPRNYGRGRCRCRPTSGPVVISHGSTSSEVMSIAIAMLRSRFHTANQTNASPLISNHGRKLAGSITPPCAAPRPGRHHRHRRWRVCRLVYKRTSAATTAAPTKPPIRNSVIASPLALLPQVEI